MLPHRCLTTAFFALALSSGALAQGRESRWSGAGSWEESAGWSAGLPAALTRARLTGHGALTLESGRQIVGGLLVGTGPGDDARLHLAGYGEFERVNFVANYYRPGPSTRQRPPCFLIGESTALPATLFAAGNILDGDAEATRDNWRAITYDRRTEMPAPFPAPPVATEDARTAFERVLENAGATLPQRDAIDARVIEQVRTRTGRIPRTVGEAGAK